MKHDQFGTMSMIAVSIALLLTVSLYIGFIHRSDASAAPALSSAADEKKLYLKIKAPEKRIILSGTKQKGQAVPVPLPRSASAAMSQASASATSRTAPAVPSPPPEPKPLRYVTTAYYLNVREEPGKHAKILGTVERGTHLDVIEKTDNGWLKLSEGGYVHGAYARPAERKVLAPSRRSAESASTVPFGADAVPAPAKPTSDVQSESGLTKESIEKILDGTELTGHGLETAILEIEQEFGINAYFTIAVMKLESGNGKSRLAKVKNNLFGLNATGGSNEQAYAFETKADSVKRFGQLIAKHYVGKGLDTVGKVAKKYCPANPKWARLVENIMFSDHLKL